MVDLREVTYTSKQPFTGKQVTYAGEVYNVNRKPGPTEGFGLFETYEKAMSRRAQLAKLSDQDLAAYGDKLQADLDSADHQGSKLSAMINKPISLDDPDWITDAAAQMAAAENMGKLQTELAMRKSVIKELLTLVRSEQDKRFKAAQDAALLKDIQDKKKDLEQVQKDLQDHMALARSMGKSNTIVVMSRHTLINLDKLLDLL